MSHVFSYLLHHHHVRLRVVFGERNAGELFLCRIHKFIYTHIRLSYDIAKRTFFKLFVSVVRYDNSGFRFRVPEDHMTAALPFLFKTEGRECFGDPAG